MQESAPKRSLMSYFATGYKRIYGIVKISQTKKELGKWINDWKILKLNHETNISLTVSPAGNGYFSKLL